MFVSLVILAQSKNLLAFECSSDAQVPYDGDRTIRANGAYTCSWVITVPENYTVKFTKTQKNVGSVGNTNCVSDYIQFTHEILIPVELQDPSQAHFTHLITRMTWSARGI